MPVKEILFSTFELLGGLALFIFGMSTMSRALGDAVGDFQQTAKEILELREKYSQTTIAVKNAHFKRIEEKTITPIAGVLFNGYISNFHRITRHIRSIALAQKQPQFWIKREKLERVMSHDAPGYTVPDNINPEDYLDRLQSEDYT